MAEAKCAWARVVGNIRKLAGTESHRALQATASLLGFTLREIERTIRRL